MPNFHRDDKEMKLVIITEAQTRRLDDTKRSELKCIYVEKYCYSNADINPLNQLESLILSFTMLEKIFPAFSASAIG